MNARLLALVPLLALAACAPRSRVALTPGMDVARYRHFGVLPFTDPSGRGGQVADALSRALVAQGVNAVDQGQLQAVFKQLKVERSQSGLDLHTLYEIRRLTFAEALVFGALDSGWKEASVIVIETQGGEPVLNARLKARYGRFEGVEEVVAMVLKAFAHRPAVAELPEP